MQPGPPGVAIEGERWSDPNTWKGKLPGQGDQVVVPVGRTIVLDVDPPPLAGLTIEGTLVFDERDTRLTTDSIMVNGGRLQIGEPAHPFPKHVTITLTGTGAGTAAARNGMGLKVLGVMGGVLDIHGVDVARAWTKLDTEAGVGETKLTLAEAPGWHVGDTIVVASSTPNQDDYDRAEIAAIADKTITLKTPLAHKHYGKSRSVGDEAIDVRAEVGLLTHNVVIQGDEASIAEHFGGHMMFMAGDKPATVRLSNIEVTRMGQLNHLGRYPIHFHLMTDRCVGCSVKDVAVHDTVQRGIVVHDTSAVLVQGNVVFNTVGHNYIVETLTTAGNTYDRNLAMVNRQPNPAITTEALKQQNDDIPTGFWIRNARNRFDHNAVGGSLGMGFWMDGAADGPIHLVDSTVHAVMNKGAPRDFNMQSGILVDCGATQPAAGEISDQLVYQSGAVGFWIEHCTSFARGMTPFRIARIHAIDNGTDGGSGGNDIEVRGRPDVYAIDDAIMTGHLLEPRAMDPVAAFLQYGGTLTLNRPVFAAFSGNNAQTLLQSVDVLGLWQARFRIGGARLIDTDRALVKPDSLTEALDDSFLPKGVYVAQEVVEPTLIVPGCDATSINGASAYRCAASYPMGFLVLSDGVTNTTEGEELSAGTPLYTKMPIARSDGAKFTATTSFTTGYEIAFGPGLSYALPSQPQGLFVGMLSPMGSLAVGVDGDLSVDVEIPLANAPKNVWRTAEHGTDAAPTPTDADRMRAVVTQAEWDAAPAGTYRYDAAAKRLHVKAMTRWFVVQP